MLTPYIKRLYLPIMTILVVLLALGPFLHAHYGSSRMLGFHMDGIAQVASTQAHLDMASFSQDTEDESSAVGVTTSYARQSLQGSDGDTMASFVALVVVLLTLFASCGTRVLAAPTRTWITPSTYALGFPPPAHAPPNFNR
jgi:hypothetical protein